MDISLGSEKHSGAFGLDRKPARRWKRPAVLFAGAACLSLAFFRDALKTSHHARNLSYIPRPFDQHKSTVARFSYHKIFDALGPSAGAAEGLFIASPSTSEPNYFYTWSRDSALTSLTLVSRLLDPTIIDNSLEPTIRSYAYAQIGLQHVCNPSGCFSDGGLGEPKFNVDGTAFTGGWGRPQRDGPGLRSLVLIQFANYLLDRGLPQDLDFVSRFLYTATLPATSAIKADLEYAAYNGQENSFDLWRLMGFTCKYFKTHRIWRPTDPPLYLHKSFTLYASYLSLTHGSALAKRLNDTGASEFYTEQAQKIADTLESFVTSSNSSTYIESSLNPGQWNRKGIDAALPLAVLVGAQVSGGDTPWAAHRPEVLATVKTYVDSFRTVYPLNERVAEGAPVSVGRYAEDVYNGTGTAKANPWYLTTVAVPHLLTLALENIHEAGYINVTAASAPFWGQFVKGAEGGENWEAGQPEWALAVDGAWSWSEGFWEIMRAFVGADGHIAEEFDRETGKPRGARDLTWSYAAFVNAANARKKFQLAAKRRVHCGGSRMN
ncbi:glycoside hydrolase family 15 protein [Botryobasidium botryosum FD-172 SS1]|uniref:glucan 1,4-alpha-glucosidase n=1 Tax=Botryobasidium botryosum (strain FD-172 SS1) TaxID=930990 RepID=A0A067MUG8_BOTB1|nr:glycoside hydrolase family 15 protein [Botryobasidium botryosum FD-172 SS1]